MNGQMRELPVVLRRIRTHPREAFLIFLWLVGVGFTVKHFSLAPIWWRDYLNYWLAPQAIWSGVNPYDVVAYSDFGLAHYPKGVIQQFNFTYPPHALFLFAPFAILPPYAAFAAWDVASIGVFYLAARPLVPKGLPAFLAVLSPATLICLEFGQTGLLSSALFLMAMRGSGVAAAVLTFKPHLGILVALALFLKSSRSVLVAIGFTIFLIAASALVFGHWRDFIDHAVGYQATPLFNEMQKNIWYILGTTPAIGYGFTGFLIYAIVSAIVLSRNFNVFTAATATFLISPYGFHYDMSAVCLGFVVLLFTFWDKMPLWQRLVASLAFLTPVIVSYGTWWVPPILLLGLFVQTQCFPGVQLTWKDRRMAVVPVNRPEPSPA
jgi:alpha-1,2-mannosyltransferase